MPIDSSTKGVTGIKAPDRSIPYLDINLMGQALSIRKGRKQHQST